MKKLLKHILIFVLLVNSYGCIANNNEHQETPKPENTDKEIIKYQNTALEAGFDTIYSFTEYG